MKRASRSFSGLPFHTGSVETGRPDWIGNGQTFVSQGWAAWQDLTTFPTVPAGSYRDGTVGRNVPTGPSVVSLGLSLRRSFSLTEVNSLELGADAHNSIDLANFGLPATFVNLPNAGAITTAQSGRVVQLSARFVL